MIATLQGTVTDKGESYLIVETGGVGFKVHAPAPLVARWGTPGRRVSLFTHLHMRENEVSLYGFETRNELSFFQSLLSVSGIGPKVALGALAAGNVDALRSAIAAGDSDYLTQLPGIGKKTAQRIVLDLRGKLEEEELAPAPVISPVDQDVLAALLSMGYNDTEAKAAVASLPDEEMPVEDRLLLALRHLGGG
jgi:Holliday junction DNA helicase RuvA